MKKRVARLAGYFSVVVAVAVLFPAAVSLAGQDIPKPAAHEYVCMVNDSLMAKPQIPVVVDGKTYYGCCPMCSEGLKKDASLRTAKDPVTGNAVDKAKAVIGINAEGVALYFESQETFTAYFKQAR